MNNSRLLWAIDILNDQGYQIDNSATTIIQVYRKYKAPFLTKPSLKLNQFQTDNTTAYRQPPTIDFFRHLDSSFLPIFSTISSIRTQAIPPCVLA